MRIANFNYENGLYKKGYKFIAGADEVGKGSIAGPVVVASVILKKTYNIPNLKESKSCTATERSRMYKIIIDNAQDFGVGMVSNTIIDQHGIVYAQHKALLMSLKTLKTKPDFLLIDYVSFPIKINFPYLTIIKGDIQIASVAAASIIAKVTRDNFMEKMHLIYPNYGFDTNKGYGTDKHVQAIKKYGLCDMHRKSFILKQLIKDKQ